MLRQCTSITPTDAHAMLKQCLSNAQACGESMLKHVFAMAAAMAASMAAAMATRRLEALAVILLGIGALHASPKRPFLPLLLSPVFGTQFPPAILCTPPTASNAVAVPARRASARVIAEPGRLKVERVSFTGARLNPEGSCKGPKSGAGRAIQAGDMECHPDGRGANLGRSWRLRGPSSSAGSGPSVAAAPDTQAG